MKNKMYFILFIISSVILFAFNSTEKPLTADEILAKSKEAILNAKTVSYSFHVKNKFFDSKDTNKLSGNLIMERNTSDSVLGCNISHQKH